MRKGNHHHRVTRLPYTSSEKKQKQHPPPSSRTAHLHVIIPSCCTASKSIVFPGLFVLASRHTIVATFVALRAVYVKDKDTSSSFRREAAAAREDLLFAKNTYHIIKALSGHFACPPELQDIIIIIVIAA